MSLDELVRDIEMTYEALAAFDALHGDDPDADTTAAWGAAREQVSEAITRFLSEQARDPDRSRSPR